MVKELIDPDRISRYNHHSVFHKTIRDIILCRRITFSQFTTMLAEALVDEELTHHEFCSYRNSLIRRINGYCGFSYKTFKFIVEEIFKEQVPTDPDIIHLSRLGSRGKDIRGQDFGADIENGRSLIVLECVGLVGNDNHIHWKCKCSYITDGIENCGKEIIVRGNHLTNGSVRSCGCYLKNKLVDLNKDRFTTHGKSYSKEYTTWIGMLQRCYNHNFIQFKDYGGRGIIVCDRWRESFENFYADMGDKPAGMSIDRRDNNGNYEPGNCRWSTAKEQANNRNRN